MNAIFFSSLMGLAQSVLAAPQNIACPSEISQPSIKLIKTPPGWTSFVVSPLYLSAAGISAGHLRIWQCFGGSL
jgi:hypothetical protein